MWMIAESTTDESAYTPVLVERGGLWETAQADMPAIDLDPPEESHYPRVLWLIQRRPSPARAGELGYSASLPMRLREFVRPARHESMDAVKWLELASEMKLELPAAARCPAYCAWSGRNDLWIGPMKFLVGKAGRAVGPSEGRLFDMVSVGSDQLQEVRVGEDRMLILKPGAVPEPRGTYFIGPIDELVSGLAGRLDELSTVVDPDLADRIVAGLKQLKGPSEEYDPSLDGMIRAALRRIPGFVDALKERGDLLDKVLARPEVSERIQAAAESRVRELTAQREREIESRLAEIEAALIAELSGLVEERDRLTEEIEALRENASAVLGTHVDGARETLRSLRDDVVAEVTRDLVVRELLSENRVTSGLEHIPQAADGIDDPIEVAARVGVACPNDGRVLLGALAAVASQRVVIFRGPWATSWMRSFLARFGAGGAWAGHVRADLMGVDDLLDTRLGHPSGSVTELRRLLKLPELTLVGLTGLENAPAGIAASPFIEVFAAGDPIPGVASGRHGVGLVAAVREGDGTFPLPVDLAHSVAVLEPDVMPRDAGAAIPLGRSFREKVKSAAAGKAEFELSGATTSERVFADAWTFLVGTGSAGLQWAAAAGGWADRSPTSNR